MFPVKFNHLLIISLVITLVTCFKVQQHQEFHLLKFNSQNPQNPEVRLLEETEGSDDVQQTPDTDNQDQDQNQENQQLPNLDASLPDNETPLLQSPTITEDDSINQNDEEQTEDDEIQTQAVDFSTSDSENEVQGTNDGLPVFDPPMLDSQHEEGEEISDDMQTFDGHEGQVPHSTEDDSHETEDDSHPPLDQQAPQNDDTVNDILDDLKQNKWSDHGHFNQEGQVQFKGLKVRCAFGCRVCSNSSNLDQCDTCLDGFSMNTVDATCIKCNDVCLTCSAESTANCLSCYPGWTLKQSNDGTKATSTCAKCTDSSCGVCSDTETCTNCKNSFYLGSDGKCSQCISDCKICSDNLACSQCYNGYFVNTQQDGSQQCKLCQDGCASCTKLTDCKKCYPGFFLDTTSQTCLKCSQNCWNCTSSTTCERCIIGSFLVDSSCVNPIDYCALMNPNGTCNQCFWGYAKTQDQSQCTGSSTVNLESVQEMIKQFHCKMREVFKGQKCLSCNATFPNCQDCNQTLCLRCARGYLISTDGLTCNACNKTLVGCKKCQNSIFCAQCAKGYFMEQDSIDTAVVSYGQCIKCDDNCLACNQKSFYCTSCASGFALSTSRTCMPKNQFNFTMLLNLDLATFTSKMNEFKSALVNLINDPGVSAGQKENFLQITKISSGSINVEGTMSASSASAIESTKKNFDSSIAVGSSFAGMQVLSSGATPIKYDTSSSSSTISPPTSSKTGMIIGIVVGVVCGVIIAVLATYFLCCRNKKSSIEANENEKRTTSTREDIVLIETIQSDHGVNVQYPEVESGNKKIAQESI